MSERAIPGHVPAEVAAALKPEETVEATFDLDQGLKIYATDWRFFGKRGERLIDIRYAEVAEARRRSSSWKTWRGIARVAIGLGFVGAGALTGSETPLATVISILLFLIGTAFVMLGIVRRDDWVELKIARKEPPPSFWYMLLFLPFYLMLQSRRRYRVAGEPDEVDAFYRFLTARLASSRHTEQ